LSVIKEAADTGLLGCRLINPVQSGGGHMLTEKTLVAELRRHHLFSRLPEAALQ